MWNIPPDEYHKPVKVEVDDSDEDIEGNDHVKEVQDSVLPLPTVLHSIEVPSVSPAQVLNTVPGEGQNLISFSAEPNWEVLTFQKVIPYGRFHLGDTTREVHVTPSQYIHARLKCFDKRFSRKSNTYLSYLGLD